MTCNHILKRTHSSGPKRTAVALGVRFGKALVINILRDIPEDLRFGRCYIWHSLGEIGLEPSDLPDQKAWKNSGPVQSISGLTDERLKRLPNTSQCSLFPISTGAACMLRSRRQRTVAMLREENVGFRKSSQSLAR